MRLVILISGLIALLTGAIAQIISPVHLPSPVEALVAPIHSTLDRVRTELPSFTLRPAATSTLPASVSTTTTTTHATTTSSKKKAAVPTPVPTPLKPAPALPIPATPSPAAVPPVAATTSEVPAVIVPPVVAEQSSTLESVLPKMRSVVVNILCLPPAGTSGRGISGSGVIIDSRGIIITAAHVGQFLLLQDAQPNYDCVIRTGSPATKAYTAEVVYLSPSWIAKNPQTITTKDPTGTGEDDFALLAITGSATSAPLPSSFPSLPLSSDEPTVGEPVVIGSYGAEFLDSAHIRSSLFPTLVYSTVKERYTFGTNTIDILSLGGSAAAQEGSSGGGAANENGKIIGVITTSSSGSDIAARDLHAVTVNHIRRSFMADRGETIDSYVSSRSVAALISNFSSEAQSLAVTLVKANNF